jgi:phospholipid-binding lipoprotein MlaA
LKTTTPPVATRLAAVVCLVGALAATGCASTNSRDPLEGFNRGVFAFNEAADKVIIKPVAQGYDTVVPLPGKVVVSNLFANLTEPLVALNNLLQGKGKEAISDLGRFLINSSVGILGAFDIASEMGIEKHEEDFGQTFGRWGVGEGAYVVWPIIGPRTLRDTVGFFADGYVDPVWNLGDVPVRNSLVGLRFVNQRAQLLPLDKTLDEASTDKYAYVRDAYLQRRRSLIRDGKPLRDTDEGAGLELPAKRAAGEGLRLELDAIAPASTTSAFVPNQEGGSAGSTSTAGTPEPDTVAATSPR